MKQLWTVDEITAWLNEAAGLSEALLEDLALTHHGYSVHLRFKLTTDRDGRVLDEPVAVTFDFDAVHTLSLVGDLTRSMVHHPERINWGLSEVVVARIASHPRGVLFEALWEGDRKVEVLSARVFMTVPDR